MKRHSTDRRILLINWRDIRNPEAGGAEVYYHEIFRRLASRGYRIDVLSHAWSGGAPEELIDGVRVLRRGSRALFNYQIIPYVKRHADEYGLIIEDLNKLPFFTPLYVRRPRLHLAMHFFGTSIFHETALPFALYVYFSERLVDFFYRRERFVAISKSTAAELTARTGAGSAVDVVEPGVDTSFYSPSSPKSARPLLVCLTRLMKYKNVQFLIDAMPRLRREFPGLELAVAGKGAYSQALEVRARARGVGDCVRFMGRISESEKRDVLSRATLFVNPSAKEGWGITSVEAALCGTATVASDVAGLRDSVRHGETGLLFGYNDQDAYVAAISELLRDPQRRSEMECRAREVGLAMSWDAAADKMELVIGRYFE